MAELVQGKESMVSRRILRHAAARHQARVLLSGGGRDLTFGDAAEIVSAWAARMIKREVRGRVIVALPGSPQLILTAFAVLEAGAVPVLINPAFTAREREQISRDSDPGWVAELAGSEVVLREVRAGGALTLSLHDCHSEAATPSAPPGPDQEGEAIMFYTSGSTGRMKGVVHTVRSLLLNPGLLVEAMGISPADRFLTTAPLFHLFGFSPGMLTAVISGATIIVPQNLGALGILEQVQRCAVSILICGVGLLRQLTLLARSRRYDLSSLRLLLVSGSILPPPTAEAAIQHLCPGLLNLYGTTETGIICQTRPSDQPSRLVSTAGSPLPGVEVRVVGEQRQQVARGAVGEIACRTAGLFSHYHQLPEQTRSVRDEDGWYYTGDLGQLDEEGYLSLMGRKDDMIIKLGFNVYPKEVELVLLSHPAVRDAVVVAAPHERYGQCVRAVVVREPEASLSEREIVGFCAEQLVHYKVPDEVFLVEELPKTPSGKVNRSALREPGWRR